MEEEKKLIKEFGREMQGKLDARSSKGRLGWRDKDIDTLLKWLEDEAFELVKAVGEEPEENIRKECADVANVAMMIWDKTNRG